MKCEPRNGKDGGLSTTNRSLGAAPDNLSMVTAW